MANVRIAPESSSKESAFKHGVIKRQSIVFETPDFRYGVF